MRDNNLLLTDAAVAASAFAANALALNKTPVDGIWLQFVITKLSAAADGRLDITIYAKDADAGWATTDDPVGIVPQVGAGLAQNATIIRYARVSTKHLFAKPRYVVAGTTPSFTIVCGVVTGVTRDIAA